MSCAFDSYSSSPAQLSNPSQSDFSHLVPHSPRAALPHWLGTTLLVRLSKQVLDDRAVSLNTACSIAAVVIILKDKDFN